MKTFLIRVKGERDPWWTEVKNLLSGRGIRRELPEKLAVTKATEMVQSRANVEEKSAEDIRLCLSHEGQGPQRAVTVLAYTRSDSGEEPLSGASRVESIGEEPVPLWPRLRSGVNRILSGTYNSKLFGKFR